MDKDPVGGLERRRHKRMASEIKIQFREVPIIAEEESLHMGYTLNVCATGAYLRATKLYRPGTMLELKLDIPDAKDEMQQITVSAKVAWVSYEPEQEGMGVEFHQVDEKTKQILLAHAWRSDWHA